MPVLLDVKSLCEFKICPDRRIRSSLMGGEFELKSNDWTITSFFFFQKLFHWGYAYGRKTILEVSLRVDSNKWGAACVRFCLIIEFFDWVILFTVLNTPLRYKAIISRARRFNQNCAQHSENNLQVTQLEFLRHHWAATGLQYHLWKVHDKLK